ncbi:MAG: F0F1 ATP synthase subunit B [Clostridia bacterium]|nr:F0F1 ATP synthase subunit B [Clostridia bacterium]MBR0406864.1 F0F1 ATP synthase subunit B [Clostridia bacterium]
MQSLDIISINIWNTLISLLNLLLIYWIMKKFLFARVQKVMNERRQQVDKIYSDADESRTSANQMKQEYETRLASARQEADTLIKTASQTAQRKSDQIVAEANTQASHVKQKAEEEIAQQKKQMLQEIRSEISELAVDIASKVVEREINQKDYDGFVEQFIQNVGEKP